MLVLETQRMGEILVELERGYSEVRAAVTRETWPLTSAREEAERWEYVARRSIDFLSVDGRAEVTAGTKDFAWWVELARQALEQMRAASSTLSVTGSGWGKLDVETVAHDVAAAGAKLAAAGSGLLLLVVVGLVALAVLKG